MEEKEVGCDCANIKPSGLMVRPPLAFHRPDSEVRIPTDEEAHQEFPLPTGAWLLVRIDSATKSIGGVLLPAEAAEASADRRKGTVLYVGPGCYAPYATPGSRIVVSIHDAHRIPLRTKAERGEVELRLVHEDAVLAVLTRSPEALAWLDTVFPEEKPADVKSFTVQGEVIEIPTVDGVTPGDIDIVGPDKEGGFILTFSLGALSTIVRCPASACPANEHAIPEKVREVLQEGVAKLATKTKVTPA